MLADTHARMLPAGRRNSTARSLVEVAHQGVQPLLEETLAQLDSIEAARAPTRYELLRKLNQARSFLHSIDDRPVKLPELAGVAGISQFHLLRSFRSCFGHSPSAYHRRIRLEAWKRDIGADYRAFCALPNEAALLGTALTDHWRESGRLIARATPVGPYQVAHWARFQRPSGCAQTCARLQRTHCRLPPTSRSPEPDFQ